MMVNKWSGKWCEFLLPSIGFIAIQNLFLLINLPSVITAFIISPIIILYFLKKVDIRACTVPLKLTVKDFALLIGVVLCVIGATLVFNGGEHSVGIANVNILNAVVAVIIAPINEELVYRGLTYMRGRDHFGVPFSTIVSSLLFAVGHTSFSTMISAFFVGMILNAIYQKYGNIFIPIIVHCFINGILMIVYL